MKTSTSLLVLVAISVLLPGCRATTPAPASRLRVEIETVELLQLESYPVQLVLHVEGWLPNPCSSPAWEVTEPSVGEIGVELYALSDGSEACIQVLAPFEVNIPLGARPTGGVRIVLNGGVVGQTDGG
jgi:hypothetical protein